MIATSPTNKAVSAASTWLAFAERHWHPYPGRPDLGFFGTGTVAIQSLEAVAQHAFVCATLARHPAYDAVTTGLARNLLIGRALAGLRYLVETHITGALECVPATSDGPGHQSGGRGGGRWGGDGWSPVPAFFLWLVAEALGVDLPAAERAAVQRVLAEEADANLADQRCTVLEHHGYFREVPPIPTGRFGVTWPESNAWRGAVLAAAQLASPDHLHVSRWDESLKCHFVNALSVPQDAATDDIVDGLPVRQRFVGANVHPNFALEHHGFLHPCYAARTMEFMVLTQYAFQRHGRPAPESASHHLLDEWQMLRRLVLWQGRLAYPAGKDHHRYGWGLTYLLPVVAWLQRRHAEPVAALLEEQLTTLFLAEQARNADGSFVRERMGALLDATPGPQMRAGSRSQVLYYRAEADPPFYLLLAQQIHEETPIPGTSRRLDEVEPLIAGTFEEPDAGLVFRRDAGRFASWSWNAYPDAAQGLFVPRDGDHLVEWNGNLAPSFVVLDAPANSRSVRWRHTVTFDGGFATLGAIWLAGGAVEHHALYVALPDGRSALYADEVRARWDLVLLHQEGLRFNLGNDLFNDYRRHITFEGGETALIAGQPPDRRLMSNPSPWLLVDNLLGVQFLDGSGEPWTIRTFPRRNATDMSAWYAILARPLHSGRRDFATGAIVQRTCTRLVANVAGTEWLGSTICDWPTGSALAVELPGLDHQRYCITANWRDRTVSIDTR
jgi:hypothetical protein